MNRHLLPHLVIISGAILFLILNLSIIFMENTPPLIDLQGLRNVIRNLRAMCLIIKTWNIWTTIFAEGNIGHVILKTKIFLKFRL